MALARATRRDIARCYAQGRPLKVIAHEFGISPGYVSQIALREGAEARTSGRTPVARKIDENAVLALFNAGLDTISISARMVVKPCEASNALARARDRVEQERRYEAER